MLLPLGGLYRHGPTRSAIQSLVAYDLASAALLVMCDRLASSRYDGSSSGGPPSAAAFAQVSAASLPSTPWCAGVHRVVIVLLRLVMCPPTSWMAMARHCRGPTPPERARSAADSKSENMVYWWPLSPLG